MEVIKRGRKPLPTKEKKTEIRFFIENKYLKGGIKKAAELCINTLKNAHV